MFVANLLQQTLAGVAFAVVFVVAVLLDDRLRRERNDLLVIGMNHGGSQHLMLIGDLVGLAVLLLQTRFAMDLFRREISGTIQRQQITAVMKDVRFQRFPALQLPKDSNSRWRVRPFPYSKFNANLANKGSINVANRIGHATNHR